MTPRLRAPVASAGAVVAVVALAATVLSGCGVTAQDRPVTIQPDEVPFGLLRDSPPTPTTEPGSAASIAVTVYFVTPDGLGSATREVSRPVEASKTLEALLAGPEPTEARLGFRSALVPDLDAEVSVRDRRAVVELGPEFLELSRAEQALAVAQVVYTLTELDGVDAVRFESSGERLNVPVRGGEPTSAPVDRSQVLVPSSA